jgi:hypothetical protein
MFLTLQQQEDKSSLFAGIAHVQTGNSELATTIAAAYLHRPKAVRNLLGLLVGVDPASLYQLCQGVPDLHMFAECARVRLNEGQGVALTDQCLDGLPALLAYEMAYLADDSIRMLRYFELLFTGAGLLPPLLSRDGMGIDLRTLSQPPGDKVADGPLVSVVLTVHNGVDYLTMATRSILDQSWQNLELIIVDDASDDNTRFIATELAAEDPRIRVITLPTNVGLWKAKNIGFSYATGEYITMHDADDWSHRQKIEKQIAPLIRNPAVMATSSNFFRVDETTGRPYTRNACSFVRWNPSSFMFKRQVLNEVGNFLDQLLGSDCEFVARVESRYGVAAHVRVRLPLSIGYQRSASLSNRFRDTTDGSRNVRFAHWEKWRWLHVAWHKRGMSMNFLDMDPDSVWIEETKGDNQWLIG